ncbi:DUF3515 domain-containing protein [Actinokineospora sp. NBRC 105648]|uniref:DUF3515 domain-containing protein n=1 Tax=Actinokineospora sp. NBRC 105648 TaxID=3032206 RepID=UPI0024A1BF5D|nr:DUF3515 domain-containing protein [Actinokineospora sp. NBRC 105648]GLZ41716.1 hypothetical protein Acsp05_53400 [Actinokineospora sp. NBRC 105648]
MSSQTTRTGLSRTAVTTAAVLVALLAVGVVVASRFLPAEPEATAPAPRTGPVGLVPVDAPDAGSPDCAALLAALPASLVSGEKRLDRLAVADPAPPGAAAWGDQLGDPVVLRCGLGKPPELTQTSGLREVSRVRWLPVEGDGSASWFVVDRPVYVALTLPSGVGTGPLQTVSEVVGRALAERPVRP